MMDHIPRVLVGLIDSEPEEDVVRYASMVARLQHGEGVASKGRGTAAAARRQGSRRPQGNGTPSTVQALPAAGTWNGTRGSGTEAVRCEAVRGADANALLQQVDAAQAELLLVGVGRASRRATARNLARKAGCSVWIVPEDAAPVVRRILVPIDFSERSADSLRVAIALAKRSGRACCQALHVYFNDALMTSPQQDEALRREKEQAYRQFIADIDCRGVTVEPLLVEGAKVAHVIGRVAESQSVDSIVMATRGRTSVASFLLGSVTEQMVMKTRVPLLVVKNFGARMGVLQVLADPKWRRQNNLRFN